MKDYGVWEPSAVKIQTLKTAVEAACMLLRVDDIVSGVSTKAALAMRGGVEQQQPAAGEQDEMADQREQ